MNTYCWTYESGGSTYYGRGSLTAMAQRLREGQVLFDVQEI